MNFSEGRGADVAFEAVGICNTINEAIKVTKPGGRIVLVGILLEKEVRLNIHEMLAKELDIKFVWRYLRAFPTALALLGNGKINTNEIIIRRFPLDEIQKVFPILTEKKRTLLR